MSGDGTVRVRRRTNEHHAGLRTDESFVEVDERPRRAATEAGPNAERREELRVPKPRNPR